MSFLVRCGSGRFAGVLAFGVLLVLVSAAPVLAGSPPADPESEIAASVTQGDQRLPDGTDIARGIVAAEEAEAEAERRLESPAMEAERFDSLTSFLDVEGDQAAALLRAKFDHELTILNADPARLFSIHESARVLAGGDTAVLTVDGMSQILDAGIPLKVDTETGTGQRVDLSLVEAENGAFLPEAPVTEVTLPAQADGAIEFGDSGIGIEQLGVSASSEALPFGDKNLFYSEVDTDTDLLVAPISRGVEIFNQLRSPNSPEELRFRVTMPNGAELVPDGIGGAEVRRGSDQLAEIPFPTAVDAQGADVPVTMEILGNTLVLEVAHRDAGYAYPLLVDPVVTPLNEFWWSASSWDAGANLGVLTDGTWDWDPHAPWVYGSSGCINEASCWGSGRGLYVTAVNGEKGPNEFGRWIYAPPGETSYITEAWIAPFHRNNNNPTACSKNSEPEPHDYVGLWTGSTWAPSYPDLANDVGSAYLAGGGRELHIGLSTSGSTAHIPCWRDIAAGGVSILVTDPDVPSWSTAPSAADTWTDTTVVPISTGTASDAGLGTKYFNLYKSPSTGATYDFIGNTERACSGLSSSPCGASWSSTISNYSPASLPNGVNLLTVFAYDALAIEHHSEGRPVRVKVDHAAPQIAFSGEVFTKGPKDFKGQVTATDGSSASLATAQSGVKSVKTYVDGVLVGRFPDEASPPACNKPQEGFNIASCEIKAPVELTESLSGTHTFKAVVLDSLDHKEEKSATLELPVDNTPPSLAVTGALKDASGLWVKPDELSASLKAEDAGTAIAKVELLVDGKTVGSATTEECFEGACELFEKTFKVALAPYAAGAHTVKAVARDGAGNEKSTSWTINVDPADPTLDPLVAPELPEGWDPQQSSVKLEYSAADLHSGVKKIEVRRPSSAGGQLISKPVDSSCTTTCPASVSGSTTFSTEDMAQGPAAVTVKAYDASGRLSSTRTLVVLVDRDEPAIAKASGPLFTPSAALIGVVTELDLEVTDKGGGVRSLEFFLDGEPVETLGKEEIEELGGVESCGGDLCELEFSLEPLVGGGFEPGDHEVELVVTDRAGHSTSVENEVTIDTRVPEVELSGTLMDTLGEGLDEPVRLDVNAMDGDGEYDSGMASVEVTVDGEPLEGFAPGGEMVAASDEGNDRIQIFDEEGEFVRAFGSEGSNDGELDRPVGIAIDGERNVWAADAGNDRVQAFSEEGDHLLTVGTSGNGDGEFERPEGVAVDSDGNVWVADTGNGRLQVFEPDGDFIEVVGLNGPEPGELGEPVGLGADPNGGVWVADRQYDRVVKFSSAGEFAGEFGSPGVGNGMLDQPESIEIGVDGTVWVSDQRNHRIQGFDSEGKYLRKFGTAGTGTGQFTYPAGIATDSQGRVWAVDSSHSQLPAPPSSAPIAAYSFDAGTGTVAEDSAANHDGAIEGATWTEGKFGKALEFDGTNDCVSVPNSVDLQLSEAFTLEAWINPDNASQWAPVFFKEGEGFYSYSLFFGAFSAGHLQGYIADEPYEWTEVESPGTLTAKTWSHVAMTSDRTTLRLYVNGNLVDSASAKDAMESEKPLWIGCSGMWSEKFEGKIDEARIYDRALSQEEIAADRETPVNVPLAGDRIQRWQTAGTPSFDDAFGAPGTGDGEFDRAADIAVAKFTCGSGPCGQSAESFIYDPSVWGPGPHTVMITATDQVGNVMNREPRVNEPLNVVAPECPSVEPEILSGGEESDASAVVSDIETAIPEALEPSEAASEAALDPAVTTAVGGVSLNEMGIDVVAAEAGGGIEDAAVGSFTVGQAACLQPRETSADALEPTIVNDVGVVYPNSAPDTDTVVRPTAAGTAIVQRVRGEDAPSEFSWKVQLEPGQELVELEDGSVAVVDPEGIDLDPESVPPAPEEEMAVLTDAAAQIEKAEHDLAAANEELTGEVTMVIPAPMVLDEEEKVTPGILRIVGASVVVAELPPGTLADAEALIILMSPAAEPETMCMSVMARAPEYAAAACADEEIEDGSAESTPPPFQLKELAQTSDWAFNAELLGAIEEYEIREYPEETFLQKVYCEGHRERCKKYRLDGALASIAQAQLFNNASGDGHMANALKHSLWNALMKVSYLNGPHRFQGWEWALLHEQFEWMSQREVPRKSSRMDLLNNSVGFKNAGSSDLDSCEIIRHKSVRAHYIGLEVDPSRWAKREGYEYFRPVYRKLQSFPWGPGTKGVRVTPTGKHCGEIRIGWGPITINPFNPPFGIEIE